MAKFKIDVNSYDSLTFPLALYKWVPGGGWFGRGKWRHYQSYANKEDALKDYDKLKDIDRGMPIILGS